MVSSTMSTLSYGITNPTNLLSKLMADASKIAAVPHPHDTFNFLITAAVLSEWIAKYYPNNSAVKSIKSALENKDWTKLPNETLSWIANSECLPNNGCDPRLHVWNATRICWHTANASKHFQWCSSSNIAAIEDTPNIKDWYQYFFTSTTPGLYIEYDKEYYSIEQIRDIVVQFYCGLLSHIEETVPVLTGGHL